MAIGTGILLNKVFDPTDSKDKESNEPSLFKPSTWFHGPDELETILFVGALLFFLYALWRPAKAVAGYAKDAAVAAGTVVAPEVMIPARMAL